MKALPKSIVFITGAFLSNDCWDEWKAYFESKGYRCIAPAWPYKEGSPEELRNNHPDSPLALTRLSSLVEYYSSIVRALPERPILIGHSLGGLIVQLLLQQELGSAGVAIDSFPPKTLSANLAMLKTLWESLGLFTSTRKTYMISFRKWSFVITNGMNDDEQKDLYYKYATPESKMVIRDSFKSIAKIDFNNSHPPLLFTSGGQDRMIPASLNYDNYRRYKVSNSITDYMEFKERNHLAFGGSLWREDADFVHYWLEGLKETPSNSHQ